jgi:hypothetical protein
MLVKVHREAEEEDSRPAAFELGATEYRVEEILDRWFGTDSTFFKVRADDGNFYIFRHNPSQRANPGRWRAFGATLTRQPVERFADQLHHCNEPD